MKISKYTKLFVTVALSLVLLYNVLMVIFTVSYDTRWGSEDGAAKVFSEKRTSCENQYQSTFSETLCVIREAQKHIIKNL